MKLDWEKDKIWCRHCGTCFRLSRSPIESPTEEDFRQLKTFLGSKLGAGLSPEELPNMSVIKVLGRVIACISSVPCGNGTFYLTRLKVARPFRRQGLAETLLEQALADVNDSGDRAFAVTVGVGPSLLVKKIGAENITKEELEKCVPTQLLARIDKQNAIYWRWKLQ